MLVLTEEQKKTLENNLSRLVRMQGSDPGFYILATHSFIEGLLRDFYQPIDQDSDRFYWFIDSFKDHLISVHKESFIPGLDILGLLKSKHQITNKIRHRFHGADEEEARAATQRLVRFCNLAGIDSARNLALLKKALSVWGERKCIMELSEELKRAEYRLGSLDREKTDAVEKLEEYQEIHEKMQEALEEKRQLEDQLRKTEKVKDRKDARVDELRRRYNEEKMKNTETIRELTSRLEELESTRDYLDALSRVTVYTRTRFDYERSITRFTRDQNKVLEQISLGSDFLIKGAAGTGKTLVLIKAVEKAKGGGDASLGFSYGDSAALLTYTNSLVKYNSYIAQILGSENPADWVGTADSFLWEQLRKIEPQVEISFSIVDELAKKHQVTTLSAEELAAEVEHFIWGNDLRYEDYVTGLVERRGMKKPLRQMHREEAWAAALSMAAEMEERKIYGKNYARVRIIRHLEAHPEDMDLKPVDFIFIDEAQDLSAVDLKALKLCARKCVVLAGDSDQSIYLPGFSFARAGIAIQGRTRILRTNFRNTLQLQEVAEDYRAKMPRWDPESMPESFRWGPPPEIFSASDRQGLLHALLQRFDIFINHLFYDPENICIIVPMNSDIITVQEALAQRGFASANIRDKDFDFSRKDLVRISTMHSSKGLDFPVVLLYLPRIPSTGQYYKEEVVAKISRNLIYVSITRAMDHLNVFYNKNTSSQAILDLVQSFQLSTGQVNSDAIK